MTTWKYLPEKEREQRLIEYKQRQEYSDITRLIEKPARNSTKTIDLDINYFSPERLGLN